MLFRKVVTYSANISWIRNTDVHEVRPLLPLDHAVRWAANYKPADGEPNSHAVRTRGLA